MQQKLKATEAKLADLTGKDQTDTPANLSPEQTKAIEQFRADMLQTRRQLRDVQAALRSNIQRLKDGLEFLDIALIPIIVAVVAIIVGAVRRQAPPPARGRGVSSDPEPRERAMQKRSLILLLAATVGAGGCWRSWRSPPAGSGVSRAGPDQRALPGLADKLGEVASVEVRAHRPRTDLCPRRRQLARRRKRATTRPTPGKIRRIVLALADMTLVEPKTAKPDLYPRLEVEDPGKGKSTLVTIKDKSGAALARLIVGKQRYDRLGEGNDGVYVRKPGDPQSWLARGVARFFR